MIDIGNLHVIDYYLHKATYKQLTDRIEVSWPRTYESDFDIETEQREGWAYDDYSL